MRLKKEMPEYKNQKKYFEYLMKCSIGKFRQNIYMTIKMGTLFCIVGYNKNNTAFKESSKSTLELISKLNILLVKNFEIVHSEVNLNKFQNIERLKICFLVTEIRRKYEWILSGGDIEPDDEYFIHNEGLMNEWVNSLERKEYLQFGESFYNE